MPNLVFLDTETTSLRPDRRAWEVALIVRKASADDEYAWFLDAEALDLGNADPHSLRIGRFHERHPVAVTGQRFPRDTEPEDFVLRQVELLTRDAVLVGAVPNFDAEVLAARMRACGICPSWHYHLVDVETLAAGRLRRPPRWDFDALLAAYGLVYDETDRHTALGDARMVRDLYDAVMAATPVDDDGALEDAAAQDEDWKAGPI